MASFPLDNFFSFSPMQGLGRPAGSLDVHAPLSGAQTPGSEISSVSSPPVLQRLLMPQTNPAQTSSAVGNFFFTPQGTPLQPPILPQAPAAPAGPVGPRFPGVPAISDSGVSVRRVRSHFAEALDVVNEAERLRTELLFILKFPITAPTPPGFPEKEAARRAETPSPKKSPQKRKTPAGENFRSPFSDVPENFQRALEAVDAHGFGAIRWAEGWTALHWAAQAGRSEICSWLLARNADPLGADRKGKTPLSLAQEMRDVNAQGLEVLQLLQKAASHQSGVAVSSTVTGGAAGSTRQQQQQQQQSLRTVPPREKETPNFPHLPEAYEEALRAIHRHGWGALKWSAGWSALHWAAQEGRLDVVKYLVDSAKAPVDIADKTGRQPVYYAAKRGNESVVEFLLARGATLLVSPLSNRTHSAN